MLSEEWIERFARTEAAREVREKERRREARRCERPKVPAALAAEQRVEAVLAARRAAEQRQQREQPQQKHGDDDSRRDDQQRVDVDNGTREEATGGNIYHGDDDDVDALRLYGKEGAQVIARLEANLNAQYDALIDLKAPPYWPCEPLR